MLDVSPPNVYLRPDVSGADLTLMNIKRSRAGFSRRWWCSTTSLRGKAEVRIWRLRWVATMMELYPPHFCFVALDRSPQAVKQVVYACLHRFGVVVPGDHAAFDQIAREIVGRMDWRAHRKLRLLIERRVARGMRVDIEQWVAASELTACRVGLLLSGDLSAATQMVTMEEAPLGVSTLSPRDKIRELVLYSITPDYFAARRALGVQVSD